MRIPVMYDDGQGKVYAVEEEKPTTPAIEGKEALVETKQPPVETTPMAAEPDAGHAEELDYHDLYLRAMAEMANFRRRVEMRSEERIEEERRRLLQEFLEFADNLERALAHLDEPGLRRGVRLTWEGLWRFLEREGVEPIEAVGQPFDPQVHEAASVVDGRSGHVVDEVQRGYRFHGRLLRPARVVVGK